MREIFDGTVADQHGIDARGLGSHDIDFIEITDIQGLLRLDPEGMERHPKDPGIWFLDAEDTRIHHDIEIFPQARRLERLLDSPFAVRYYAEEESSRLEPGQGRPGGLGNGRPEVSLLVHPDQAVPDLAQSSLRYPTEQKQRLKIRCCALLIGPGALHRPGRLDGTVSQVVCLQRQAQRTTDTSGQAGVVEKQQRIARVEQNSPQNLPRAR